MILTVTPNPALDVTYRVDRLVAGSVHRVRDVRASAGGKGVNVARVLAQTDTPVVVSGLLGGPHGDAVRERLDEVEALEQAWAPLGAGVTRQTVAVVDDAGATLLNEPGPTIGASDWEGLLTAVRRRLAAADETAVVTVSGSLPPGAPDDALRSLIGVVHDADGAVVVDTSGSHLLAAAESEPDLLKPNHEELAAAVGIDDPLAGALELLHRGARRVAVSRGQDGMLLVVATSEGPVAWSARPAEVLRGNATGAGDAAVAALSRALLQGVAPEQMLREAVALSAAAVLAPVAGEVDVEAWRGLRRSVVTEEVPCH